MNRLTSCVPPVVPFTNFRGIIEESYYPDMTTFTSQQNYPPRQENTRLLDGEAENERVDNLIRWFDRIHEVVDQGYCIDVRGVLNTRLPSLAIS